MEYNTNLLCTYMFYDEALMDYNPYSHEYKNEILELNKEDSGEEKAEWSDMLYKNELASVFSKFNNAMDQDQEQDQIFSFEQATETKQEVLQVDKTKEIDEPDIVKKIDELFDFLFSKMDKNESISIFFHMIQNKNEAILPMYYNPFFEMEQGEKEMLKLNFQFMFSYPLFHMTHICICDLLKYGAIKEENMEYMQKIVTSKIFSL